MAALVIAWAVAFAVLFLYCVGLHRQRDVLRQLVEVDRDDAQFWREMSDEMATAAERWRERAEAAEGRLSKLCSKAFDSDPEHVKRREALFAEIEARRKGGES